jgi:hypothetical protein
MRDLLMRVTPPTPQVESLVMDAKARGLEESSPMAISLQQIIVALNMVSKVICIHHCKDACKIFSKMFDIKETACGPSDCLKL